MSSRNAHGALTDIWSLNLISQRISAMLIEPYGYNVYKREILPFSLDVIIKPGEKSDERRIYDWKRLTLLRADENNVEQHSTVSTNMIVIKLRQLAACCFIKTSTGDKLNVSVVYVIRLEIAHFFPSSISVFKLSVEIPFPLKAQANILR